MTKRLKPEQVWARIEASRTARKSREEDWRDNLRILSRHRGSRLEDIEVGLEADINLCYATVRTMVPSLYFQGPDLRVVPENPQGIQSAPLVKALLDQRFRKSKGKRQVKKAINDSMACTYGWLKVGYVQEEVEVEEPKEETEAPETGEEAGEEIPDSVEFGGEPSEPMDDGEPPEAVGFDVPQQEPDMMPMGEPPGSTPIQFSMEPPEPEEILEKSNATPLVETTSYLTLTEGSHSNVKRVSPFDILFDMNATGPDDDSLEWIAQRVRLHMDDCVGNSNYKQGALKLVKSPGSTADQDRYAGGVQLFDSDMQLEPGSDMGPLRDTEMGNSPDDEGKFVAWEFWDIRNRRIYVIPESVPNVFIQDRPMPFPRHPFFGLVLTVEVTDEPYPDPVITMLKGNQHQLNEIRSAMIDHIHRATPRVVADSTLMDDEDQKEFKQGGTLPFVRIKGDVSKAFAVVQGTPMNSDMFQVEAKIQQDAGQTSGISEFQRGSTTDAETTATRDKIMAQTVSVVIEENRDRVADLITDCCTLMLQLEKMYTDKKQIVRIVGDSDVEWREWDRTDILGEYDISVVAGSQVLTNRAIAVKQALDAFNLFSPIALQGGPVNFYPLAYNVLETMGFKNIDLILPREKMSKKPQDPHAENELMLRGGMPEPGINDNDQDHIQVHMRLLEQKGLDPQIVYIIGQHIRQTQVQMQQKMMMQQQAQMQAMGGMPGAPGGQPNAPGVGRVNGPGAGRQQPAPGQPASPRQFAEAPQGQGMDSIMRVLNHARGPQRPGG